ncbi:MAG TPA: hypothetical protein VGO79_09985 [Thermoanaerobaculia bacterium]|jgi:hypothetical protein
MERTKGKRSGWLLVAGSLVLVGVLSVLGTAREQAKAVAVPAGSARSAHAAATNVVEPGTARAEFDVLEMQLD